ncbi:MAG: undecaprenyldiphospho-muramoylpentapeptide beta-N-acetylglucosaminyltransferase [Clostridia bacterium]|nr:undecaprenyldiphospho-muramoylpentapeptide beta-N-acetylglucosaminyltransferase [Clostridia bacterium]
MATIVLTGGGSAGHCTPHLAILPHIKEHFNKIFYIGSENGIERNIIEKENIPYYAIPCAKLVRKFTLNNLKIPFKVLAGIKESGRILDKIKPDVIFSKGGYVSVPTIIAGHKRNIPIISHESDYTIGLANKISAKYCKKVLTTFPDTAKELKNAVYVGAPIRNEIFNVTKKEGYKYFNLSGNKPVLLVLGGSQGSKIINDCLKDCLPDLLPKFDVIHLCGKNNAFEYNKKGFFQAEYISKIEYAFAIADVCISRAGSNSVFELLSKKIPTVLIPLPKGISRGDQELNALYFERLGLVSVLPQNSLTKQSLYTYITGCYSNRFNIIRQLENYPILDQSKSICKVLVDYIEK